MVHTIYVLDISERLGKLDYTSTIPPNRGPLSNAHHRETDKWSLNKSLGYSNLLTILTPEVHLILEVKRGSVVSLGNSRF